MKGLVDTAISQPISVAVGVLLSVLAGVMAVTLVPVRMTPEISSVVVSVTTNWESASAEEVESDIVEEQEKVLSDVNGLVSLVSTSASGQGTIRLEFETGTDIRAATAEVLQKLDEVPGYPDGILQPVVEPVDSESVDYIAWVGLASSDPDFRAETLYDLMERRLKPHFERIPGVSKVGARGAVQSELHIIVDPAALANRGITYAQLRTAIESANANFSAGRLEDGKRDIRVRSTGRFEDPADVGRMVVSRDEGGTVYLSDVAKIEMGYKEPNSWVRARGHRMPFFNFQLQRGSNLLETMGLLQAEFRALNAPDGLLAQYSREIGLNGTLQLVQTYDSTTYVADAIDLVRSNLVIGGVLATLTLLFFLRSLRTVGIIAIAIPVSVMASMVVLLALGRTINIISLAGLAFAVGMVVDNAIVVIENIYRHLEMGKKRREAAVDGTREVAGAVVASTLTTLVVFAPILFIQETAGQLFRDIALAIMAAVGLSMVVALTVIPTAAARYLQEHDDGPNLFDRLFDRLFGNRFFRIVGAPVRLLARLIHGLPDGIAAMVGWINRAWPRRLVVMGGFAALTIFGTKILLPPLDYLPRGNRNVIFGLLFPPPGYNLDQLSTIGARIEDRMRPAWETTPHKFEIETLLDPSTKDGVDHRMLVPAVPGGEPTVMPPKLDHYFLVSFEGRIFHGAISADKKHVVDAIPLMNWATSGSAAPDTFAVAFQAPLFRVAGTTGDAIKIDIKGSKLDDVYATAGQLFGVFMGEFGPGNTQASPPNFSLPLDELRVVPVDESLRELGMTRRDLGLAVQAAGEGILLFRDYEQNGELKDMKIISEGAFKGQPVEQLLDTPIATPAGSIVDLGAVARIERVLGPDQIRHVDRLRAVTLEVTPPQDIALEDAVEQVRASIEELQGRGGVAPGVDISIAGSAGALNQIKTALLGDGSFLGTITSSLFLAFFVVYLLMVILFQSWTYPLVMILSVPLATFGGFLGLAIVHRWSLADPYMPVQKLDMLSILGFVILAGVVVNNAILIVHQALNFLRENPDLSPQDAIRESVRSRVRPILMSTMTSVGGMLPLVLMPGAGSELYRGLGGVVVGGLAVSTIFTMFLVPTVLGSVFDLRLTRQSRDEIVPDVPPTPA